MSTSGELFPMHSFVGFIFLVSLSTVLQCANASNIISCYFEYNRPKAEEIDTTLCTHLILIGSCVLDSECRVVLPPVGTVDDLKLIKQRNDNVKVLFSFTPSSKCMSKVVLSAEMTDQLTTNFTSFIVQNALDGIDIDWEFPVYGTDSKPTDKKGFAVFLQALRGKFEATGKKILITLAVAAPYTMVKKSYDVDAFNSYVDYVQIMNYDFHMFSKWQPVTAFNAPLFKKIVEVGPLGRMNSDYSTRYWISYGLFPNKTVFGIPTYGRGYTLADSYAHFVYAPAINVSMFGPSYVFNTVCKLTHSADYTYVFDTEARSPYIYGGQKQWLGFEDMTSMFAKATYAKRAQIAGIMIFDLGSDDYSGSCGQGKYPLIHAAKSAIEMNVATSNDLLNID